MSLIPPATTSGSDTVRVFVSYSHKDSFWKDMLLPLFRFPGVDVKPWSDTEIQAGQNWDQKIHDALKEMDVFAALISVHFAVSKYIDEQECRIAEERHKNDEIEVLPIYLGAPSDGDCEWLMKFQRVPGEKSWSEMRAAFPDYDHALKPIRDGIKAVVERARQRKAAKRPRKR